MVMTQTKDPHVQYQSMKAAEDTFAATEKLLNYISMKDIHYVDEKTASAYLEIALMLGIHLDVD